MDPAYFIFSSKNNINYFTLSDINNSKIEHLYENDIVLFLSAISKPGECELHKNQCLEVNYFKTSDTIERLLSNGVRIIFLHLLIRFLWLIKRQDI